MKIKAIINPVSGQNGMRKVVAKLCEHLKANYGLETSDILYTSASADDSSADGFFDDCDTVVIAGGDGTLHYAINCMKQQGVDRTLAIYQPVRLMISGLL